jgi:hypothetical protein
MAVGWQRVENGLIAVAIIVGLVAFGQPWWIVFAAFLLVDLSALGYLAGNKVGAQAYNVAHNYTPAAVLFAVWAVASAAGADAAWVLWAAASWAFHVAVDRALGYGLKLQDFAHTHLGPIGPARRRSTDG